MNDEEEYLPEFNALDRVSFLNSENVYANSLSTFKTVETAMKICEAVALTFITTWTNLNLSPFLVQGYLESLKIVPFLQYKSPTGLFLGWLMDQFTNQTNNQSTIRSLKTNVESENWPEKVEKITMIEIFRYYRFWNSLK